MPAQVFNTFLIVIVLMMIEVMFMQSKPRDLLRRGEEQVNIKFTTSLFLFFFFSLFLFYFNLSFTTLSFLFPLFLIAFFLISIFLSFSNFFLSLFISNLQLKQRDWRQRKHKKVHTFFLSFFFCLFLS